jgi:hypothetical protein
MKPAHGIPRPTLRHERRRNNSNPTQNKDSFLGHQVQRTQNGIAPIKENLDPHSNQTRKQILHKLKLWAPKPKPNPRPQNQPQTTKNKASRVLMSRSQHRLITLQSSSCLRSATQNPCHIQASCWASFKYQGSSLSSHRQCYDGRFIFKWPVTENVQNNKTLRKQNTRQVGDRCMDRQLKIKMQTLKHYHDQQINKKPDCLIQRFFLASRPNR